MTTDTPENSPKCGWKRALRTAFAVACVLAVGPSSVACAAPRTVDATSIAVLARTQAPAAPRSNAPVEPARSAAPSPPAESESEPRLRVEMFDNGSFAEDNAAAIDREGQRRIPWWRSTRGMEQVVELDDALAPRTTPRADGKRASVCAVRTRGDDFIEQPVAAYAPMARSFLLGGSVLGRGRVVVVDGSGDKAEWEVGDAAGSRGWRTFAIHGDELAHKLDREPMPRFLVRFESADGKAEVSWRDLSCSVELPCPSESDLRAEIEGLLKWAFHECITRGIDSVGPMKTGYYCHDFDAITGERLMTVPVVSFFSFFEQLRLAVEAHDDPEWSAALDHFIGDQLTIGLDPTTGLPRAWDCMNDVPRGDVPLEIGLTLGFLVDVAERGPAKWKAPARAAAIKIGETVLAKGVIPDGNLAASYVPADGTVNLNIGRLRRFDTLAQLTRLSALTGDVRFQAASREALAAFEFTHFWSGTWQQIDPAFDDEYGHYGARAATSWRAAPNEPVFRELAFGGWRHFAPLWRDAVRLGGTCAADQVRCWVLLQDVAALEPSEREAIRALTHAALRGHFKGEQDGSGAWQDLTVIDYDPQLTFAQKVGDFPGPPQNLLHGLAALYDDASGLRTDETRALFTTVLRSSVTTYKRAHGFLIERTARDGPNSSFGTLRLLLGLTKMYRKLG